MFVRFPLLIAALTCVPSLSQQLPNGKPDFTGNWQLETRNEQPASGSILIIDQNPTEVRIRDARTAEEAKTAIQCGVGGKECKATIDGNKGAVTFWYDGQALVEMETSGDNVTKIRRTLSPDGKKLIVEVSPIVPSGKATEKLAFVRVEPEQRAGAKTQ